VLVTAQVVTTQSAFVSHAADESMSHVPSLVPSPGVGSSTHVPIGLLQVTTFGLPQVEFAAQKTTSFKHRRETAAASASVLRARATQLTYWP
jgi:hypothetical protein